MNKYYSLSPSNKKQMQQLLSPIFEAVRKNKIHSYHQLQKKQIKNATYLQCGQKNTYIFEPKPKTANTAGSKSPFSLSSQAGKGKAAYQTLYSPSSINAEKTNVNFHQLHNIIPSAQSSRNNQDNQNNPAIGRELEKIQDKNESNFGNMFARTQQRIFRVNSKIKKHLVEDIDFEQIQKMFYKKRQTMTRYQYFLKLKSQAKNQQNKRQGKSCPVKTIRNKDKIVLKMIQDIEQNINLPKMNNDFSVEQSALPLKCPQRKKFWLRQPAKRSVRHSNFPETIVQGTSYRTIQI